MPSPLSSIETSDKVSGEEAEGEDWMSRMRWGYWSSSGREGRDVGVVEGEELGRDVGRSVGE
jgi:hypothetical protein